MSQGLSDASAEVAPKGPWSSIALSSAVVGAVFGLVFSVLLVGGFVRWSVASRALQYQIASLKGQLQTTASADEMISGIRQLDLRTRRETLRWTSFSRTCGLFLLVSVAIAAAGLKASQALRGPAPSPAHAGSRQDLQARQDRYARWSVAGALAVLVSVAGLAALQPVVSLSQAGPTAVLPSSEELGRNWYRFRGPQGSGISPFTNITTVWDGATGRGVAWKTPIPLAGHNSPVVWGNQVFVSGADQDSRKVFCLDAATGKVLWTGDVPGTPAPGLEVQEETGFAACTMATDGIRVYALFAAGDLAAFDLAGRRAWTKNLGVPDSAYGYASSLDVFGGRIVVQYDQGQADQGKSKVMAFDGATGRLAWEKVRPVGGSWTSPIVARAGQGWQLITAANPWVIAYDPNTGDELWRANVAGGDMAPSPICAEGRAIIIEPYSKVVALRTDAKGDVTTSGLAWTSNKGGPDICSPVSDGKVVYLLDTDGTLSVINLADGTPVYQKSLDLGFRASPTLVGDTLTLLSEKGTLVRVAAGSVFRELGRSELGEACHASPAFADGRMFIRGKQHLFCIASAR